MRLIVELWWYTFCLFLDYRGCRWKQSSYEDSPWEMCFMARTNAEMSWKVHLIRFSFIFIQSSLMDNDWRIIWIILTCIWWLWISQRRNNDWRSSLNNVEVTKRKGNSSNLSRKYSEEVWRCYRWEIPFLWVIVCSSLFVKLLYSIIVILQVQCLICICVFLFHSIYSAEAKKTAEQEIEKLRAQLVEAQRMIDDCTFENIQMPSNDDDNSEQDQQVAQKVSVEMSKESENTKKTEQE